MTRVFALSVTNPARTHLFPITLASTDSCALDWEDPTREVPVRLRKAIPFPNNKTDTHMPDTTEETPSSPASDITDGGNAPTPPIEFHVDSVAEIKMQALLALAEAQKELARALGSTCTAFNICNNTFFGAPNQTGPALSIDTKD